MKKVKLNIEYLEPEAGKERYIDAPVEDPEKEMALLPGRILNQVLEILEDSGAEIMSFQKQEVPDYISKIVRDMDSRERKTEKDTVQII